MKIFKVTVGQELQMKNDPILGTKYELVNVIIDEEHITETPLQNCKHNTKQLIHIGSRNYCTVCQEWISISNTHN